MSTFEYRDRLTIITEILKTTNQSTSGKKKTDITRSANLSYPQGNKYLHLLLTNGLLRHNSGDRYTVTQKGFELVRTFESLNLKLK